MRRSVVLLICGALAACSASRPEDTATGAVLEKARVRVSVGGQAQFIYLPLTLADRLGFFREEGITVEISDLKGGSEALAALLGGSADMVAGFYEHTIRAQAQGKNIRLVALFDRFPGLVLVVGEKHRDRVKSIQDLVGHPVGVTAAGSSTDAMLKYLLSSNGLDPQAIPAVTTGTTTMVAALEQDRIWAGVTVDPLATIMEERGLARPLYDTRTEEGTRAVFGGPWPAGGLYTTEEFLARNPRTARAMVAAATRTLQYIAAHSAADIAARMPESFYSAGPDLYVRALAANMAMFSPDGRMPDDGPSNVLKTLMLMDPRVTAQSVDLQRTFTNEFVDGPLR